MSEPNGIGCTPDCDPNVDVDDNEVAGKAPKAIDGSVPGGAETPCVAGAVPDVAGSTMLKKVSRPTVDTAPH
jgi:hypothetical protein